MSQYNTQAEPRSGGSSSYDMKPDPTPYELVVMENEDLRARLQLADERAFEQAATIARLRADEHTSLHRLKALLSACADMLVCIRDNPEFHAEQRKAARALMGYGVVRVCNQDLAIDAEAGK